MLDFDMRYSPKYGLIQNGSCIKRIPHSYYSILVREEVPGPAVEIHKQEGSQTGIPTRPGLSAGNGVTKGVLLTRTPALRLIDYVIFCYFGQDSFEFTESVCQIALFLPLHIGGF
jgi:hypothetical protein